MSGWNTDFTVGPDFKGTVKVPHEKIGQTQPDSRQALQARIATYLPDPPKDDAREELSLEDAAIRVAALKGSATLAAGQAFANAQTGDEAERNEQARTRQSDRLNALASLQPGARVTIDADTVTVAGTPAKRKSRKPSPAEAVSAIERKLERMPEDERLEFVTDEKWSPGAREMIEEAYQNTLGAAVEQHEEELLADLDEEYVDLLADFRNEAD